MTLRFGTMLLIGLSVGLLAAQDRYVRAAENANHDLVITRSTGERIVVSKSDRKWVNETQVAFENIAVSRDGNACWMDGLLSELLHVLPCSSLR